jgi:phenylalanyl-tRNA synthetase alpha chain
MGSLYDKTRLESKEYKISLDAQEKALKPLLARNDAYAERVKRYLTMPDLPRTPGSPLFDIVARVRSLPIVENFDNVIVPEVVPADITFDLFDFPPEHPARSMSDTYYVDDKNVLRTHDTVMWYYYLNLPEIKAKIAAQKPLGVICYGKVYRKDEIDRHHMNVFHQMDGLYLVPDRAGRFW